MSEFAITGIRVLTEPLLMKRGAKVLATFDVEARGFRLEECRLYHIEGKGWAWWTPHPRVRFPSDLRGPVKEAAKAAFEALRAP